MSDFQEAYAPVKEFEGGWCNVAGDAGGETYAGVARNFFPEWEGWQLIDSAKTHPSFKESPRSFSKHLATITGLEEYVTAFYRKYWWDSMGLGEFPQNVANEMFEQAVNLGKGGQGKILQRLCNAMNYYNSAVMFPDLVEDGVAGKKTMSAFKMILKVRKSEDVVHALNALQGAKYIGIAANSVVHRKFLSGWMTRTC